MTKTYESSLQNFQVIARKFRTLSTLLRAASPKEFRLLKRRFKRLSSSIVCFLRICMFADLSEFALSLLVRIERIK